MISKKKKTSTFVNLTRVKSMGSPVHCSILSCPVPIRPFNEYRSYSMLTREIAKSWISGKRRGLVSPTSH
jgi:hypothetical protein